MELHNLIQGSPEWHTHRATHFNASDAPAMMGVSPYETRTQLLYRLHTGIAPEVDAATQARFDEGHRSEARARPLAEEIIGDDLFPVTGSDGELSASFDGLTMNQKIDFEHKSLNAELAGIKHFVGQELPLMYRIQMEQQLLICKGEKCLFMVSKWNHVTLIEERHCWYAPDLDLRVQILAGWSQFAIDLAAYTPTAPTVQAVAAPVESLPAVRVQLDGQLVVASNLPEFAVALRAFIERIPAKPSTDQEFADCESACKALKKAEDALESAETHALAQMTDVESMRRMVADLRNLARATRLASEKTVAARKESIRGEIVQAGKSAYEAHEAALCKDTGGPWIVLTQPNFAGAIKGLRTVDSIRNAVDTELAGAKIVADASARKIRESIRILAEEGAGYDFLFNDSLALISKAPDDLRLLVKFRIDAHQTKEAARIEADRARIANEERIKVEAAATAKAEAQRKEEWLAGAQQRENERQAEIAGAVLAVRAEAEKQAQDAIAAAQAAPVPAPAPAQPVPAAVTVRQVVQPLFQSTETKASAVNTIRAQINARLDGLSDADLRRILSFLKSRYPQEEAA